MNMDFDPGVIKAMKEKTHKRCPKLQWTVGDIRQLPFDTYPNHSYDCIIDKGLLDAMVPSTAVDVLQGGEQMLQECTRLLKGNGVHILITLLQDHVWKLLLQFILQQQQQSSPTYASIHLFPLPQNDLESQLCPFAVILRKASIPVTTIVPSSSLPLPLPLTIYVPKHAPPSKNSKQRNSSSPLFSSSVYALLTKSTITLAKDVSDIDVQEFNLRSEKLTVTELLQTSLYPQTLSLVHSMQWQYHVWRQLVTITGETYLSLDLWTGKDTDKGIIAVTPTGDVPLDDTTAVKDDTTTVRPRYTVTIVDRSIDGSVGGKKPNGSQQRAAVLLVPQGREYEFSFSSKEGQAALVRQANVDRLIFVQMNRGHSFANVKQVQNELSPVINTMVPVAVMDQTGIPYLAVADNVGWREMVAEGTSASTGDYFVENVADSDNEEEENKPSTKSKKAETRPSRLLRRLLFTSNRNAIQSEASLTVNGTINYDKLRFPYHQAMVAALGYLDPLIFRTSDSTIKNQFLVIGLGGGGLAMYLASRFVSVDVWGIELDPTMVHIAESYFGCRYREAPYTVSDIINNTAAVPKSNPDTTASHTEPGIHALVGDGLEYIKWAASTGSTVPASTVGWPTKPMVIFIDVDAKDMRTGLSFPPAAFVSKTFLQALRTVLHSEGILLINLGARSTPLYNGVLAAITNIFGKNHVALIPTGDEDGDVNCVVMAGKLKPDHDVNLNAIAKQLLSSSTINNNRTAAEQLEEETIIMQWLKRTVWKS